jgi:AraC family transcriptional regulator, ethanolamine operon transcriptional activator
MPGLLWYDLNHSLAGTMPFSNLVPSQHLQIFSYEDIDHFRHGFRDVNVDIVPLANFNGDLGQAVLSLPGCTVYLLRTFPRIVRSALGNAGTFFLFSLKDAPSVIFNGKEPVPSSFTYARGPAEYRAVEREPGFYAAITFVSRMEERGWPQTDGEFLNIPLSHDMKLAVRAQIAGLFGAASQNPDLNAIPGAGIALVDSLLETLDLALAGHSARDATNGHRNGTAATLRVLRTIDEFVDANASRPIYSEEIASVLGVSVRTLANLMIRSNDMSLQRYLRLRRLWSTRQQLLSGAPNLKIKEVALAHGFWHMGDFAARYFRQFGEHPSSTHLRARASAGALPSR